MLNTVTLAQEKSDALVGKWKLDMSPHNLTDNNFAMMEITEVKGSEIFGTFYREGVRLTNGQINTQTDVIYGALMSGDNSGTYNSTFYLKDGKLYGTTHAVDRGFLSVWVATKED
jgi:hypothetical protein